MDILHLTLKRKWFDMIASGEKREEYREIKPHWDKRLIGKRYDVIEFRNGYGEGVPRMTVELDGILIGNGNPRWGATIGKTTYVLLLGKVLEVR